MRRTHILRALCGVGMALSGASSANAFVFSEFVEAPGLNLVGDAVGTTSLLRLTSATFNQGGAAWFSEMLDVSSGFQSSLTFALGAPGGLRADTGGGVGADGMAMVFQSVGNNVLGKLGGGMGYRGLEGALAIEIDTWQNDNWGDANGNHIAVTLGDMTELARFDVPAELLDGQLHTLDVVYEGTTLSLYLDAGNTEALSIRVVQAPILTLEIDLSGMFSASDGFSFVGLTGATGGAGYAEQVITDWSFTTVPAPGAATVLFAGLAAATRRRR